MRYIQPKLKRTDLIYGNIDNEFTSPSDGFRLLKKRLSENKGVANITEVDDRTIMFMVLGKSYKIRWFWNQMTLIIDENINVMFEYIHNRNTWPTGCFMGLQFELNSGKTIAHMPTMIDNPLKVDRTCPNVK